jgi:hypothetical protein
MLTPDVRVEDFDVADWIALKTLFGALGVRQASPADGSAAALPGAVSTGLVVLVSGDRVVKVLSTRDGRIAPNSADAHTPLQDLCRARGAAWGLRLERSILLQFSDRWAKRLERQDDLLAQVSKMLAVVRELSREGRVETHPRDVNALHVPSERLLRGTLDFVCPPGKTLLFGVFEGSEVSTAVALHRGAKGFDRIVGPSQFRRELGLVSVDWTTSCRGLARAVELGVGPVALGCFAQASTWQRLPSEGSGAFARAVAARDIVLHPLAPAIAIPLGVDVGRAAYALAKDLATKLGAVSWLSTSSFRPALEKARELSFDGGDIARLLGFDPFAILRQLLSGEVPHGRDPADGPADGADDEPPPGSSEHSAPPPPGET